MSLDQVRSGRLKARVAQILSCRPVAQLVLHPDGTSVFRLLGGLHGRTYSKGGVFMPQPSSTACKVDLLPVPSVITPKHLSPAIPQGTGAHVAPQQHGLHDLGSLFFDHFRSNATISAPVLKMRPSSTASTIVRSAQVSIMRPSST